jgi:hypothetical protein
MRPEADTGNKPLTPEEARAYRDTIDLDIADSESAAPAQVAAPKEELETPKAEPAPVEKNGIIPQEPAQAQGLIDPALQTVLDGINNKLDGMGDLGYRLKQAESRIGSVQNAVQNQTNAAKEAADEAARVTTNAPDKEAIAAAMVDDKKWADLKTDYPEWGDVFAVLETRFLTKDSIPKPQETLDISGVRKEIADDLDNRFDASKTDIDKMVEKRLVDVLRPGWRQKIQTETGMTPEYNAWFTALTPGDKARAASNKAVDAIASYDSFIESQVAPLKATETPEEIQAKRDARLDNSQTVKAKGKTIKAKSVDDMTDDEFRASLE